MRQVTRKGLITMAAAGGALAIGGGYAQADSGAFGGAANSPGVASGNTVQVPVSVPVNVCGNTVNVVGLLNPAIGNTCANKSGTGFSAQPGGGGNHTPGAPGSAAPGSGAPGSGHQGSGTNGPQHGGGAHAGGGTSNSPGVGSGNTIQVPVDVPVNACGNTVDIIGLLNPAGGNTCVNQAAPPKTPEVPGKPAEPVKPAQPNKPAVVKPATPPQVAPAVRPANNPAPRMVAETDDKEALAHTGAGSLGLIAPVGAGLLLGGALLYRRARASA
jgi:hypothetical protein